MWCFIPKITSLRDRRGARMSFAMDGTIEETKKADHYNTQPSTVWNTLRAFLIITLVLSGGFALMDLYKHGQSIREHLLHGAFIGAFIVLGGLIRERSQRSPKSRTYLPPGN